MPKVKTEWFRDENLEFKYDIYVNVHGEFTTTLPEDVAQKLMDIGVKLRQNKNGRYGFMAADTMDELTNLVWQTARKYSQKTLYDDKIVVLYRIDTNCHYCLDKHGQIQPNGSWLGKDEKMEWIDGTKGDTDFRPYALEFYFNIKRKIVWQFPNGELQEKYDMPSAKDCIEKGSTLHWLDSVVKMAGKGDIFEQRKECKEIEYNENIGQFFKNLVLYICNINEKIRKMFDGDFDLSKIDTDQIPKLDFRSNNYKKDENQ